MQHTYTKGFALPTVMIASVVMLMVLLSGLVAASSVNVSLNSQNTDRLVKQAAEAGVAMAEACLRKNNYIATWSTNPLRPGTRCDGTYPAGLSCPDPTATLAPSCGVIESTNMRTGFSVSAPTGAGTEKLYSVAAYIQQLRTNNRAVATTKSINQKQSIVFKNDPALSRPAKRFWLFGNNAGLDFGASGNTVAATNKCASGQACHGGEGFTVISTKLGNLQFWTNGQTIWNKNGLVMLNSTGLNASSSATQAAAVFPLGSDETKYVVVTNNTVSSYTASENKGELFYSIVDMSLDGGLGGVTASKNVPLAGALVDYASEGMTAAPKSDGTGYWVITFTPDTARVVVFSFDNAGNVTGPGYQSPYFTPGKYSSLSGFGSINFNADYSRLIMMAGNHCVSAPCAGASGLLRLMSFDNATGAVENLLHWDHNSAAGGGQGYSADFSPSGNYIYSTTLYQGRIFRYTLAGANTGADVKNSEALGYDTAATTNYAPGYGGGQVVRAPDGKMYVANYGANAVSVINNPDAPLAANIGWVYNGMALNSGAMSTYGLPQTVTIYTPRMLRY